MFLSEYCMYEHYFFHYTSRFVTFNLSNLCSLASLFFFHPRTLSSWHTQSDDTTSCWINPYLFFRQNRSTCWLVLVDGWWNKRSKAVDNHSISCCFFNIFVYSRDDLARAIKKLHIMGSGFQVIPVGKKQLVQSVPGELSMDHTAALQLAQVTTFVTLPTPVL